MPLTTVGRNFIAQALINASAPAFFDNTNSRIGVGDSTTAFSAAHTDLQGANKIRKGMEAGYPQIATNVLTFRSVYTSGEANFTWNEWGVFNHATAGVMLNRKVENLGTKTSAAIWQLTVDLTVNIGS